MLIWNDLIYFSSQVFLLCLVELGMKTNSIIYKNPTHMHIQKTDPLGILLLWYKSHCPFTLCCSSPPKVPFSSRKVKFLPTQHTLCTTQHTLCTHWKLLFPRPVHIVLARYQNLLTNGRLSGNMEKNFKHVLYLLGVQPATLRWGLPSKQAGLGIQLQNNYRCKENTFPLRRKLDDILQSSVG